MNMKKALQKAGPKALQESKPIIEKHTDPVAKPAAEMQKTSPAEGPTSEMAGVEVKKFICELTGVAGPEIANQILSQMRAMQIWGPDSPERNMKAVEMMAALKPTSATEALLAVQMFGVHEAALLFLKRATCEGQTFEGTDANVVRATKLLRVFAVQLEAMAKLKGKAGQQKVTVEHVHVYKGGQAIVGAMGIGRSSDSVEACRAVVRNDGEIERE
jgi:hypothetical protein